MAVAVAENTLPVPTSSIGVMHVPEIFDKIWRIVSSAEHEDLGEALLADFFDILPFFGDVANAMRIKDAIDKGIPEYVAVVQTLDFIAGLAPGIGTILDILTPTNTIAYLLRKGLK